MRPCKRHRAYLREACKDLGKTGSHLCAFSVDDDDDEPEPEDVEVDDAGEILWDTPGWGMSNYQFERLLQMIRHQTGATEAALRRVRENRRLGSSDPSWNPQAVDEVLARPLHFDIHAFTNALNAALSRSG